MKKIILLTGFFTLFTIVIFAKHVDEATAKIVGQHFLTAQANTTSLKSGVTLELVYQEKSNISGLNLIVKPTVFFYVFNANGQGFVIVAADDNVMPILAYSDEGTFDPGNIPPNARKWLEGYKSEIRYVIDNNISATVEIQEAWERYQDKTSQSPDNTDKAAAGVNPLVLAKWNQSPYYNALCPGGSVTGCVATAMAQIMKYWNYPASGSGFHSYNHQTYGTLSANFGSTTYQWNSMPNVVNSPNSAVATLMYQVGVSVNMNYSPNGSGAYTISAQSPIQHCSEYALKTYFGYKNTLQGLQRAHYSQSQWINLLKNELDAGRPVLYSGFGSGGGHAFVCDGYDNSNYFHFNWGWGGAYDGYFSINALNPSGVGTGGGSGGYNNYHQALIGIQPPTGNPTYNLRLYNYVTPSASSIYYGQSFTVTTNIANNGNSSFSGDYCAAVFDNQYNFIDYVELKTGYSLQAGNAYSNNLVFQNSGLFGMLPGSYYIGIFYRPTGGNWVQVSNSGNYVNLVPMQVINPSNIELYSAMTVSPGTTLIQGQPASVNLNLLNDGVSSFTGQYQVNLYNLDGSFAQTINTISENNGLPAGYIYQSPYLTFNTNSINVAPGTYLLAAIHKATNGNWRYTGSSYHQNPIKVTVQGASLGPDQYEVNNTVNQAYALPLSFSGATASKNTVGSNLHIASDKDYYKINLPFGYDYTITARLHDSYNSGNQVTYSVDALFSYSVNGGGWSDTYDDVMPGVIVVNGGGVVYFHVAPYFAGETGTYLLDMAITRSIVSVEEPEPSDLIYVYPNPASEMVYIDLNAFSGHAEQVNLINMQGQQVGSIQVKNMGNILQIPVNNLAAGIYFVELLSDKGILTKKIVVTP